MNRDVWTEVIQYLEPIDLLASMVGINTTMQSILENCVTTFDDITQCCCNGFGVKISYYNSDCHSQDENYVKILGNARYFINLYLLKLSIKLGDVEMDLLNENPITKLDDSDCNLLEFYRSSLLKIQYERHTENRMILRYIIIGDKGIGKTGFHHILRTGEYSTIYGESGIDFCVKKVTLSNGISIKHQIWDTSGKETFLDRKTYLKSLAKYQLLLLICFSMNDIQTLDSLEEWMSKDRKPQEIIIGLHPYRPETNTTNLIQCKDAVIKAWMLNKSVFVEVNSKGMKKVYAPSWFLQLQFAYFKDLSTITIDDKVKTPTIENSTWGCSIL